MEIIHERKSFWERENFPYFRVVEITSGELATLTEKLDRLDIIEWLMWNDRNGIYCDESSVREFGEIMSREEGLEIMLRQADENRVVRNLKVI